MEIQELTYLFHVGAALLAVLNIYLLRILWLHSDEQLLINEHGDVERSNWPRLKPALLTLLTVASFGGLFLGGSQAANTYSVNLQGNGEVNAQAANAELRAEREAHFYTKKELEGVRKSWAVMVKAAEQESFEKDVDAGSNRMEEARKRLLDNREDSPYEDHR